ncbi:hypothetical protein [Polaribacter butkevichii]|uniref:Uncharacterized protein n=1 Tax=Polaribacter butkevichii TaxID=218490 RepID=A0A2P6CB35_9FLAO|nr:hypothetical protein [Polaribacter butkevichii]PQJ72110.1 hypothetical protein BTO14_02065 [Polaribacter butkevichii]
MDKNDEILFKQKKQNELKLEVQQIKSKLPKYIIWFIFILAVSLYFLEDKIFHLFGNNVNFLIGAVLILCFFLFLFLLKSYITITKKQKESKDLGVQLYNLMKLEADPVDE